MEKPIIVCVDDEKSVLNGLRDELKFELGANYSIEIADSGEEGIRLVNEIRSSHIDIPVVISDQLMPGMKGDEFLAEINRINTHIRKILLTGQATAEAVGNAVNKARLYRFISKPWNMKDLIMTVEEAARSYFIDQELGARIQLLSDLNQSLQVLSDEIKLDALIHKILNISLKQTGGEQAAILFYNNQKLENIYRAVASEDEIQFGVFSAQEMENALPLSMIEKIRANEKTEFSGKAFREEFWRDYEYVKANKLKSFYAAPIKKVNEWTAVLYIDHKARANEFSQMRLEFLSSLTQQAAISIDKALLYRDLDLRVVERTREIESQKKVIEEKSADILDSIHYARRIQNSLLPDLTHLRSRFPESFVIYQPKDIVSGDFYWTSEQDGYFFAAAVDCTGHGVPGAFMSVLGNAQLNEIVNQQKILETDQILNELNRRVISHLNNTAEGRTMLDGMDVALCRIDVKNKKIQYSGANRPAFLFKESHLEELRPDRQPVGVSVVLGLEVSNQEFTPIEIPYETGNTLYIFTDGVTDQFGEKLDRKFSKRSLVAVLTALQKETMDDQKADLCQILADWKGAKVQTDDILLMGLKLH